MYMFTCNWRGSMRAGVLTVSLFGCGAHGQPPGRQQASPTPKLVASPTPDRRDHLIRPGEGVGALRLGDSRERAVELFGKPAEEYRYGAVTPCVYTELHWLTDAPESNHSGIFIFLKEDKIYQIKVDSAGYATPDGIESRSSPDDIRRHPAQMESYELLNSGSKVVGGENLRYLVSEQTGVAYELFFESSAGGRRVSSVIVFEPRTTFLPKGCISPPQVWQKIESPD